MGHHQFIIASLDGAVRQRVTIVPDGGLAPRRSARHLGNARVDWQEGTIERGGRSVSLSSTERRLLACLIEVSEQAEDGVVPRESLIANVWPTHREEEGRNGLAVYVHYLRQKLAAVGLGDALQTVRGVGYRLVVNPTRRRKSA